MSECDVCGVHEATRTDAPIVVNNRLYRGETCDECYYPPEEIIENEVFAEGSHEADRLKNWSD